VVFSILVQGLTVGRLSSLPGPSSWLNTIRGRK
jgi:hypothetical protein